MSRKTGGAALWCRIRVIAEGLCSDVGDEAFGAEMTSDDVLECKYERRYGILRANLEQIKRVRYVRPAKETGALLATCSKIREHSKFT